MPSAEQEAEDTIHLISWKRMQEVVRYQMQMLSWNQTLPTRMIAVARGGMIPGAMLAHELGFPMTIRTIQMHSYPGGSHTATNAPFPSRDDRKWLRDNPAWNTYDTLVIDDLWDTGATMLEMRERLPDALFMTMFWKDEHLLKLGYRRPPINFPGLQVPNVWTHFPWEKRDI